MRLDKFLIALVVFSSIMVGGSLIWFDMVQNYDIDMTNDTGFNVSSTYNIIDNVYDQAQEAKGKTMDGATEGEDTTWESMVKGGYSAIRFVKESFALVGDIFDSIAKSMGIPTLFINVAMSILIIAIVFATIYLVFRFKN